MEWLLLMICSALGLGLYVGVVRPFIIPLSWQIPTGRAYRATLGASLHR